MPTLLPEDAASNPIPALRLRGVVCIGQRYASKTSREQSDVEGAK